MSRAMLDEQSIPQKFWCHALDTATYIFNRESLNVTFDESFPKPKSTSLVEDDRINEPIVQNPVRSLSLEAKASETYVKGMEVKQHYHNLWDVIVNGDLEEEPAPTTGETSAPPAPKTAKQLAARRINLDKAYDRFQKLISQLEVHGAPISKEDINQKFLRSLPSSWNQIALIMRNKPDIDEIDIDDLYNNLRVYEDELKRSSGSNSASQNLAFLSSENTGSTNEVSTASGDFGVSTAGGINQVPSTPCSHDVAYSFLAQPTTSSQLENEDFQQMDGDDLEELDLRWQVAMLTVRALVAQDGLGGYDWSNDFEVEPVNYALMAISSSSSSSSSDSEVQKCSKQCLESFKTLQKNYDTEREKHNKAKLEIRGYEIALESLESRILGHEKNELAWEKVVKERDELKDKIAKWEESSKNLDEILNSQMSARDKTGLGYSTQLNELSSNHETDSENSLSIFDARSSDEDNTPENDRFSKNGYKAVPPPITGNFLTPRADISFTGLDEYAIRNKIIDSQTTELNTKTSKTAGKTNDANTKKTKSVSESVVSNPKINRDSVIIEDWNSDDEEEGYEMQTVRPETQTVKTRDDKSGQTSKKQGIGFKKVKACFVCKSTDHLIKDCNFHDKKSQEPKLKNMVNTGQREDKPVWDNTKRVNHQNFSKYPHLSKTFVPSGVLTRTGFVSTARPSISTARPVCTARPSISTARPVYASRPIYPRMDNVRPRGSCSPIKRSYYTKPAFRPKDLKQDVKTFGVKNMTTAGKRAVVNTGKGKLDTDLKKSRWVWRPKGNYLDHVSKDSGSFMLKKGNPEILLQDHAVVDSGCSSHMTGNKAYLSDYEDFNGGFVAFGSDPKGGKITGKGKIKTANLDFDDVYFVDELKFNLFSVSQMCDKKNSVLFTESECLILSPSFKLLDESQVVLRAPRKDDVYSLDLKNIVPSGGITCLYANATADESKLWHRRLGHVNFKNINKLVKGHLVRGLPSKVFVNDHTCVACKKGKQHKASCKAKLERIIRKPLELLHMDLFGPVSVESINKKRYCLVVTDDFSRFSWVFFLATKDETSEILCNLIIGLEKQLNHNVKIIRCDNGTEFKNHAMNEFCAKKGIKREFNSLLPIPFWAEAVNTACYVLNRVLVTKPQNKTPYELLIGTGPNWMFDLDFLTNLMNYIPISVENQVNVDAGTKNSYVVGSSGKDKGPTQEYILLPLQPHRTRIPIEDVAPAAHEKPSESSPKDNDIQDSEDVIDKEGQHQMPEDEQVLHDELEKMVTQELTAKAMDDVSRQAFEEEKRRIASQKKAAQATSTNKLSTDRQSVSTDRPSVSTDRPFVSTDRSSVSTANTPYVSAARTSTGANAGESSFVYLGGKIPIDASTLPNADLPIDPNMPDLEETSVGCSLTTTQQMVIKQTATGKEKSNPLIANSLLKTIRLSMHLVIAMKH
ncbi:putative ribonuclease H-like domain-containing protein [Tanacetum coccineum]